MDRHLWNDKIVKLKNWTRSKPEPEPQKRAQNKPLVRRQARGLSLNKYTIKEAHDVSRINTPDSNVAPGLATP